MLETASKRLLVKQMFDELTGIASPFRPTLTRLLQNSFTTFSCTRTLHFITRILHKSTRSTGIEAQIPVGNSQMVHVNTVSCKGSYKRALTVSLAGELVV